MFVCPKEEKKWQKTLQVSNFCPEIFFSDFSRDFCLFSRPFHSFPLIFLLLLIVSKWRKTYFLQVPLVQETMSCRKETQCKYKHKTFLILAVINLFLANFFFYIYTCLFNEFSRSFPLTFFRSFQNFPDFSRNSVKCLFSPTAKGLLNFPGFPDLVRTCN